MTNPATPATPPGTKPSKVQVMAIGTLVSGCLNAVSAIIWFFNVLMIGLSTLGIGCIFIFVPIVLGVVAVFEILYAMKIMPTPMKTNQTSKIVPILQICCIIGCNPIALACGILNIVFANDPEVRAYFASMDAPGSSTAFPIAPTTPPAPAAPTPPTNTPPTPPAV